MRLFFTEVSAYTAARYSGDRVTHIYDGTSVIQSIYCDDVRVVLRELSYSSAGEFALRGDGHLQYYPSVSSAIVQVGDLYGRILLRNGTDVCFCGVNAGVSIECEVNWVNHELAERKRLRSEPISRTTAAVAPQEACNAPQADLNIADSSQQQGKASSKKRGAVGTGAARRIGNKDKLCASSRRLIAHDRPAQAVFDWALHSRCLPSTARRIIRRVFSAIRRPGETLDTCHTVLYNGAAVQVKWYDVACLHASKFVGVDASSTRIDWAAADQAAFMSDSDMYRYRAALDELRPSAVYGSDSSDLTSDTPLSTGGSHDIDEGQDHYWSANKENHNNGSY